MAVMKFKEVKTSAVENPKIVAAKHELWRLGDLQWKLLGCQLEIYKDIIDQSRDVSVILCGRRTGKSFSNLIVALEVGLQVSGSIIKYACPTAKMVEDIIVPNLELIFKDAPEEFNIKNPKSEVFWDAANGILRFKNGSRLYVAGTDKGNAEKLRGAFAHVVFCDEAGFMDDLDYVVYSILLPQTDTVGGKLILSSTPNYFNPNHQFHTDFVEPARAAKRLILFTLFDSPTTDEKTKQIIINRYKGGINNPKFRCEYLCEIPRSSESHVVPEFSEYKEDIIFSGDFQVPNYCHFYVSGDIGVRDLTIFIFGCYDFENNIIYILDEWVVNGLEVTSANISKNVKEMEKKYFKNPETGEFIQPHKRVMDNDLRLLNDLRSTHGLGFRATDKKDKIGAVNKLRILCEEGMIRIHERCKHVIYHTENARWNKAVTKAKEFEHLADYETEAEIVRGGHADGLDCLIYLTRNVNTKLKPQPLGLILNENNHASQRAIQNNDKDRESKRQIMMKMFNNKRARR